VGSIAVHFAPIASTIKRKPILIVRPTPSYTSLSVISIIARDIITKFIR